MELITFQSVEAVEDAAVTLLEEYFTRPDDGAHAVMLTGGRTPTGVYERLRQTPIKADANLHVLISDERHVPLDSAENNFAKMLPAIEAMGIDDARIMCVHPEQALEDAAEQ